ncbi:MAG: sigma factor, ECF subfamily protein [Candidatus Eremiobacteraeota bacterium]|nr:sigma factor, ECF subfamily protein [Candidatus Eremiobacteraeota bacterium]
MTRVFGIGNLALAEDVVQHAFCRALEVWKFRGVPANPSAWLMATAKNRALDVLRRERTERTFAPELERRFENEALLEPAFSQLFEPNAIKDDPLRMIFSCCDPRLAEKAQVALVLHIVCGFGSGEVAGAFVSTKAAVEKRIERGKHALTQTTALFDIADAADFEARLPAVQRALYLLFNEGYHGASAESAVRTELCREAIRLGALLCAHRLGASPASHALLALMYLHAARLPARLNPAGELASPSEQDRSRWNPRLVVEGRRLLELSATGRELSTYHLEAAIAAVHADARRIEDTDWQQIVSLYDTLLALAPSAVVALNRAIAVGQCKGPQCGLAEIEAIADSKRLAAYPFYFAARGEFEFQNGELMRARRHFESAAALARNPMERRFFEQRVAACALAP